MTTRAARWTRLVPAAVPAVVVAIMLAPTGPAAGQEPTPDEPASNVVAPGVRAATAPPGETLVELDVLVNEIHEIDERANTFTVNLTLEAKWLDERVIPPDCKPSAPPIVYDGEGAVERLKDDIWSPGFHVLDAVGPRATSFVAVSVDCDGVVLYKERLLTTVFWRYTGLHHFPYDEHRVSFRVAPFAESEFGNIRFAALQQRPGDDDFGSDAWTSEEWSYTIRAADQEIDHADPVLTTVIEIDRKTRFYWLNIILPLLLIVSISWTVFWMDANLAERLAVSITILLTVVAFDFLTSDNLPRLSYTTRLDAFYNVSYVLVALTVPLSIIAARRAKRSDPPGTDQRDADDGHADDGHADDEHDRAAAVPGTSRLDVVSRAFFPTAYAVLVVASFTGLFSRGPGPFVAADPRAVAGEMTPDAEVLAELGDADDEDDDEDTVPTIGIDTPIDAAIDEPGEIDTYQLCDQDGQLTVTMVRTGGERDLLDPFLAVYAADGTVVAADDNGDGGLDSRVAFNAKPTTCYLVAATDVDSEDAGTYRLRATATDAAGDAFSDPMEDFSAAPAQLGEQAVELGLGEPQDGVLDAGGGFDTYRICPDGEDIAVAMIRIDPDGDDPDDPDDDDRNPVELDPFLVVYRDDGTFEDSDDDGAGDLNSRVVIAPQPDTCYFAVAHDLEGVGGPYTITARPTDLAPVTDVEDYFGATFDELERDAADIEVASPQVRCIDERDELDFYRFDVMDGDQAATGSLDVSMRRQDDDGTLDPLLGMFDETGREVAVDDDGGEGLDSRIVLSGLDPGRYLLVAGDTSGEGIGAYELTVVVGDETTAADPGRSSGDPPVASCP